ncbi:hypothetical protein LSAT2_022011, partial [Lamellibrachia satsuma]
MTGDTSWWHLKKTSVLLPSKPVSWTVTTMRSTLHVLHRSCAGEAKHSIGFPERCQEEYVPSLLVSKVLEGPSIKDQTADSTTATLAIAQLKFNSTKHKRTRDTTASVTVRHTAAQETPVPMYIRIMLHVHTRKRELVVHKMSHLGMSSFYDRVLWLSAHRGNSVCQQFHREQVVGLPKMRSKVFTAAAVDNIAVQQLRMSPSMLQDRRLLATTS